MRSQGLEYLWGGGFQARERAFSLRGGVESGPFYQLSSS